MSVSVVQRTRIVLTAIGSGGDVFPYVGLGRALRERGYAVCLITNPHFEQVVREAGLGFAPFGRVEDYHRTTRDPELWHPRHGFRTIMRFLVPHMGELYQTVLRETASGPTLVVAHILDFGSRMAREKHGLPVVTTVLSPALLRSAYQMPVGMGSRDWSHLPRWAKRLAWWIADRAVIDPAVLPPLNQVRSELGLPPIERPFNGWIFSPLGTIGLFPDWYAPPQPDWPANVRLTGFPLFDAAEPVPDAVERFLAEGPPPVVFTPGTAYQDPRGLYDVVIDACQRLGRRGLLLSSLGEPPESLPAGFCHAPFAPLSRILERCAALVHHGGIGTTAAALAAGVPQVVRPMSFDQPDNAARVVRLGVGARLMPSAFRGARLAVTLASVLEDPTVVHRCAELARRMRLVDGISSACDVLDGIAARVARTAVQ